MGYARLGLETEPATAAEAMTAIATMGGEAVEPIALRGAPGVYAAPTLDLGPAVVAFEHRAGVFTFLVGADDIDAALAVVVALFESLEID
jgi:hypothetical protein